MKSCVFTIVQDEPVFLPIWVQHYAKFFDPPDIHVINHESQPNNYQKLLKLTREHGFRHVDVFNKVSFDHEWLCKVVADYQHFLLNSYDCVLFAESDELIVPKDGDLRKYIQNVDGSIACTGWEVVHRDSEPAWFPGENILGTQRTHWVRNQMWDKPLLSTKELWWTTGFHETRKKIGDNFVKKDVERDDSLLLVHLHRVDFDYCLAKAKFNAQKNWSKEAVEKHQGTHNRIKTIHHMRSWFFRDCTEWVPIPKEFHGLI